MKRAILQTLAIAALALLFCIMVAGGTVVWLHGRDQPPAEPIQVTITNPEGPFDLVVNTTSEAARIPPGGAVEFQDLRAGDVVEVSAVAPDSAAPFRYGAAPWDTTGVVLFTSSMCLLR